METQFQQHGEMVENGLKKNLILGGKKGYKQGVIYNLIS